jgi:hypothetical protein
MPQPAIHFGSGGWIRNATADSVVDATVLKTCALVGLPLIVIFDVEM